MLISEYFNRYRLVHTAMVHVLLACSCSCMQQLLLWEHISLIPGFSGNFDVMNVPESVHWAAAAAVPVHSCGVTSSALGMQRNAQVTQQPLLDKSALNDLAVAWQAGKGSATLSMAYAAAKFGEACLQAMSGTPGVIESAYVESHLTDIPFFASRLRLGPSGIEVDPGVISLVTCLLSSLSSKLGSGQHLQSIQC